MKQLFPEILLRWYADHKRDLPWRSTSDPYHIWVSEIILQQTRVIQGTDYYHRFIRTFPDVFSLAAATVEQVLKAWEGLGYYSRARNMHEAAQRIVLKYHGAFPDSYDELLKLKGIGPYTAAAIASIAFQQPVPVVDGNVFRVLSRFFALRAPMDTSAGRKEVARLAGMMMPPGRPGDFNQAMMDFGALQCVPGLPDCGKCPLEGWCLAKKQNIVEELPVRGKAPDITTRYLHYLVWRYEGKILIKQRKQKDIWYKLYDFPEIATVQGDDAESIFSGFLQKEGLPRRLTEEVFISAPLLYQLTHRRIIARFYHVENRWPAGVELNCLKVPLHKLDTYAFPRLITAYMEKFPERFG